MPNNAALIITSKVCGRFGIAYEIMLIPTHGTTELTVRHVLQSQSDNIKEEKKIVISTH